MDPTVVAAWIAAGVSVLTLAGTLTAQYLGYRATSKDAEKTAEEQRKQAEEQRRQLERTLAEQREQLDKTLKAQSEQLDRTLAEQRTRTLNERFATAAEQLGNYNKPAVRLAGVYAMAGLADDWPENRQTCVDVLCAYMRMPYEPDPGQDAPEPKRLAFQAAREVRHTVIRVIADHLREGAWGSRPGLDFTRAIAARSEKGAAVSWQGLNFDFTGVVFDGGNFRSTRFSGGRVDFSGSQFSGGTVYFDNAQFSAGTVSFGGAQFSSGEVWFRNAGFIDGLVDFRGARFSGTTVDFEVARFSGSLVHFGSAEFSGGLVDFHGARFSEGAVDFAIARFSGGRVDFSQANFLGGEVDFSGPGDWSVPPAFPWKDAPPPGVKLPGADGRAN